MHGLYPLNYWLATSTLMPDITSSGFPFKASLESQGRCFMGFSYAWPVSTMTCCCDWLTTPTLVHDNYCHSYVGLLARYTLN